MSKRRFELLTSCLHFVNNEDQVRDRDDPAYNPLFKIQPVIDNVVENWKAAIDPGMHVSIDESMIPFAAE
jgi:hypothetical protein